MKFRFSIRVVAVSVVTILSLFDGSIRAALDSGSIL
jgi:hypothetical protein